MKIKYQFVLVLAVAALSRPLLAEKLNDTPATPNAETTTSTAEQSDKAEQDKRRAQNKKKTKEEHAKEVDRYLKEAFGTKHGGKRL